MEKIKRVKVATSPSPEHQPDGRLYIMKQKSGMTGTDRSQASKMSKVSRPEKTSHRGLGVSHNASVGEHPRHMTID